MAHIQLPEGLPGIRGPTVFSPETTKPVCNLVQLTGRQQSDASRTRNDRDVCFFAERPYLQPARSPMLLLRLCSRFDDSLIFPLILAPADNARPRPHRR